MGFIKKDSHTADANKKVAHDMSFYKFVIRNIPTAVLTVNADLRITGFNPKAEEETGYTEDEVIGRYCGDILRGEMCTAKCPLKTVLKEKKPISFVATTIRKKWGETIPVRMNSAGLFDDDGRLIGAVESFWDISRLKVMQREKDNIISMFAHDMKSSITIIGGIALRLLKKLGSLNEEKQEKYFDIIKKESANLESIVDDFLDFARLQTGKLQLNFATTLLEKELMELYDAYQTKAARSHINLEFQTGEALSVIEGDAKRLRRVFTNILDNAFKFSKENTKITLISEENKQASIVKIKDQGCGIDPRDLPYIFDAFHRGRDAKRYEGSGVGLAAAKTIVEAHGGRINVESELGKGSVFTVVLPKTRKPENNLEEG
ncbi:MAG: PAS domain-containing sensor histidine kinase [Deltaproteobacteria bacterium]|nr:PAS domain-containing sensor histidine kinase [Deltaproteobacteria bacterium]